MADLIAQGHLPQALDAALGALSCRRPLVVADPHVRDSPALAAWLKPHDVFSDYTPNPELPQVVAGMAAYALHDCDGLVAIGGGSAMDVAKCIKAFQGLTQTPYVEQPLKQNAVPYVAVPTTAGTGSEATPFAVVYHEGRKHSVQAPWLQPDKALLAPELLHSLPPYQRAAGLLDALSQAIESFWSLAATPQSQAAAREALTLIVEHHAAFMQGEPAAEAAMMQAAHRAGLAIGATTTTAAHAMSYGLTHRYRIAHGHAVALCLPAVWDYMLAVPSAWRHPAGAAYLQERFAELAGLLGAPTVASGPAAYRRLADSLGLPAVALNCADAPQLAAGVNQQRLANNPATLTPAMLEVLYVDILAQ